MLQEITIRPIGVGEKTSTLLNGKYYDKERGLHISIVEIGGGKLKVVYDRELLPTERLFKKWFGQTIRDFTLIWDDSKDRGTSEAVIALQRHAQMFTPGWDNPNKLGTPQFEFIDKRKQDDLLVNKLKQKNALFNMVNNMDIDEFMSVCFFVGHNPVGQSFESTFVSMLNTDTDEHGIARGILMKNPTGFLADWGSTDKNHIVTIRKAIALKIISAKEGKFYVNNEIVGDSSDGVIAYMKVNDKLYEYVRRLVSEKDVLPLDVNRGSVKVDNVAHEPKEVKEKKVSTLSDKADKKFEKEKDSAAEIDERAILKAKMKQYGMKGWQVMEQWSLETCRNKVLTKEAEMTPVTA